MTTATAQPQTIEQAVAERRYVYPIVRSAPIATAHPAAEAWPAAAPARRASRMATDAPQNGTPFDELQGRMVGVEERIRAGSPRSMVIVPSRPIDKWHEPVAVTQALEERLLCSLLELRDPNVRMTYVTSAPIAKPVMDYYLSLLPRRMREHARARLTLVALGVRDATPLSQKLLQRPQVLDRIRRAIRAADSCHLVPYTTTPLERELALALDIPMYGADPRYSGLGTKSGCRALFARAGVPHPVGTEGVGSFDEVVAAIAALRGAKPEISQVVVKLDNGVSGEGNALVDLRAVSDLTDVAQRVAVIAPEAPGVSADVFLTKLAARGGVVEEWIAANEIRSPSVQLQITPAGEVHVVSTHDQILGGPSGQIYLGCRFPADAAYAPLISVLALRVGRKLAAASVIGRLAIDFVVARDGASDPWRPYAIELNLRKGGTTHPYETLAQLTGGSYDHERAAFVTPTGQHKHYVATDHFENDVLRALGTDGVLAVAPREDLRFHPLRRTGVVFHMLSSLDELGCCGFTAIADSAEQADAFYEHVQRELLAAARERGADRAKLPLAA